MLNAQKRTHRERGDRPAAVRGAGAVLTENEEKTERDGGDATQAQPEENARAFCHVYAALCMYIIYFIRRTHRASHMP